MSLFHAATIQCSRCGTPGVVQWCASVNADLRPDLRASILDGSFQATDCGQCEAKLRLPPHLTYMNLQRNLWIAAESADRIEEWRTVEQEVAAAYDRAFGAGAPPMSRTLTAMVQPRLVFGWPALREKIIADELGLDDVALELLKMAVMRNISGAPISDATELRLTGGDAAALELTWFHQVSEEMLSRLSVPMSIFEGIADNDAWETIRGRLSGVFWADLRRFVMGGAAQAA